MRVHIYKHNYAAKKVAYLVWLCEIIIILLSQVYLHCRWLSNSKNITKFLYLCRSIWRDPAFASFNPPPNWDDIQIWCGAAHQVDNPGTNCGVCGVKLKSFYNFYDFHACLQHKWIAKKMCNRVGWLCLKKFGIDICIKMGFYTTRKFRIILL